jgi:hypothetical protein
MAYYVTHLLYNMCDAPPYLSRYQANLQDAVISAGPGLFAGTDGSVKHKQEKMGAGYSIMRAGDSTPFLYFSTPVGRPLFSGRVEAVALFCLLRRIRDELGIPLVLVVFIDCQWLLQILS